MKGGFGQHGQDRQRRDREKYEEAMRNLYNPVKAKKGNTYTLARTGEKLKADTKIGSSEWLMETESGRKIRVEERDLIA